ncbi:membrane-associated phosphatidylinositol transfer protein 2 isoform X1 [Orcinus orca]|uniref:membrane-associated phosphatidylinositol transfer protein 2 isoform X1 n=2 Tax=Orcinus orca TaxID=9733 RepID=UPI00144144BD|nr:membrane-associated phosphatidylinositol transfer protein 2 isoform X1 [Orcinus orca]XP_033296702.1 membrane-associated phosphatidylinositol transfer protein 2 isoform X1 [Orcinus orca]XP_049553676.1 membrane-associated phosphatidylinositol transfer protein 2 isoform X1 [Orcinus orca]
MIIKEYRIPLPMTVEEYRIAQLYMIQKQKPELLDPGKDVRGRKTLGGDPGITSPWQCLRGPFSLVFDLSEILKKSRNETFGEGSGVEILENRPYTDGPGGSGQYTHKVYHVGMHIPSWFRSILPKAALRVVEESWNAYPYTRTRFTCPFVEKFSIDIETFYKTDAGENPNVFSLSPVEKNQLTIDFIDIVKDPVPPNEYKTEEDPKLFYSTKTQRGPLSENWIEEYKQQVFPIMCAYKLCKVEFRYWGMQSKIERFIHDTGLRKVMVRAHRQAWCWQDEWYGLNMENIRELEKEAQLMLSRKMAQFSEDDEGAAELAKDEAPQTQAPREPPQPSSSGGEPLAGRGLKKQWSTSSKSSRSSKRGASPSRHSISEWRMQSIARDSDESSDDEFFDAHEDLSDSEEMFPKDITKWNSNDLMDKIESPEPEDTQDGLYRQSAPEFRVASSVEQLNIIEDEVSPPLAVPPSKIHVLLLLLHGGTILDTGAGDPGSKQGDTNTIATVFDTVMRVHYPSALGHLAIRLVPCPPICSAAFALVSDLSPYSHDEGCLSSSQDHIPLAALPLLATSSPHYQEAVATVIQRANLAYGDFIKSQEGVTFNGQVCLIGDCVGGILAFDALCCSNQTVSESQSSSRRGSVASVQDTDLLSPGTTVNAAHGGTLESSRHLSRSNIDIPRSNGAEDPKQQLPRKRSDSSTYELDTIQQHQAFLSSLHASVLRNEPSSRHSSSSTMLDGAGAVGKFDFEIADLFLFGCPLGLVLALRKTVIPSLDVFQLRPACQQVYNLFHPADPSASRLEPLLERRFHALPPLSIPRYQRYPLGDGCSTLLADALQAHNAVFQEHAAPSSPGTAPTARGFRRASEISIASQVSGMAESYTASSIAQIAAKWWGQKRIDYALYCPDALTAFPTVALPHLFHASYWESTDVVSFLLRQVMRHDNSSILELDGKEVSVFTPSKPREKWQRKRTHVKLRNVTANHRINDAVANEDGPQVLTGRFMYGPLDMVTLTGEKPSRLQVDVHIMMQPPSGEWLYLDTLVTNSSGRVSYTIPETHRLGVGVYPVKMVVRGDHTFADSYITVLPKGTEFVVFSIDGSFAASVSIMGSDPKVRAGAVDVVRHWQDLGYLIIYVTGRPDMQKQRVVAWLAQHNFPHGVVSFCDGLVHDPLRHKANFLKLLISELHLRVHAAYGSTKDVAVYSSISLSPMQIYIVGRPTKKLQQQCQFITDGYAAHLAQLKYNHRARPARNAATRMALRKGSFGLPGQGDFLRSRNHLLRTISAQPSGPGHRHERTQSQADSEQRGQRSMSMAAGCWGRAMAGRPEPGTAAGPK